MAESDLLLQGRERAHQKAGDGSAWVQQMGVYTRRVNLDVAGSITTIYKGWADYGTATSAAAWRVQKIVLDETTGLILTDTQADTGAFNQVYDDRTSLTYT